MHRFPVILYNLLLYTTLVRLLYVYTFSDSIVPRRRPLVWPSLAWLLPPCSMQDGDYQLALEAVELLHSASHLPRSLRNKFLEHLRLPFDRPRRLQICNLNHDFIICKDSRCYLYLPLYLYCSLRQPIQYYTILHYFTLLYTTLHYFTLLYTTLHYSILLSLLYTTINNFKLPYTLLYSI